MILEIDAGNSAIKWRVINQGVTLRQGVIASDQTNWSSLVDHSFDLERVRVSNVGGAALGEKLALWFEQGIGVTPEFAVSSARAGGVINGYSRIESLGVDRWLAVIAGWNIVRGPCLVVDAGTALTVDFVNSEGRHGGGYIVPGLFMMFDALFSGTADVRFKQNAVYEQMPGTDTTKAVQNGCFAMSVALVKQSLDRLVEAEGRATLVLTGGGSLAISECFKDEKILRIDDLVLDGLGIAMP